MALQFDFVPVFFSQIIPRLGVALAVILVVLILTGLFMDTSKPPIMYTFLGIGVIAAIAVLINTADSLGWAGAYAWSMYVPEIITAIIFLIIIATIVGVSSGGSSTYSPNMTK